MDCTRAGAHTHKSRIRISHRRRSLARALAHRNSKKTNAPRSSGSRYGTPAHHQRAIRRERGRPGDSYASRTGERGHARTKVGISQIRHSQALAGPEENKAETHIWTAKAQRNGSEEHKDAKTNFRNQIWYSFPWATWNERTNNKERHAPDGLDGERGGGGEVRPYSLHSRSTPSARCSSMGSSAACASPSLPSLVSAAFSPVCCLNRRSHTGSTASHVPRPMSTTSAAQAIGPRSRRSCVPSLPLSSSIPSPIVATPMSTHLASPSTLVCAGPTLICFSLLLRSPSYGSRPRLSLRPVPHSDARFASPLPRAALHRGAPRSGCLTRSSSCSTRT